MKRNTPLRPTLRDLTLAELLVVLAIISMLFGMLVPIKLNRPLKPFGPDKMLEPAQKTNVEARTSR